jgi:hypothetical protein
LGNLTVSIDNVLTNDNKAANKVKRPTDDDIQRNKDMILGDEELLIMQMPFLSAFSLERGVWGVSFFSHTPFSHWWTKN